MRNVEIFYELGVADESGHRAFSSGKVQAKSFVKQFAQLMFNVGFQAAVGTPTSVTNVAGSSVTTMQQMGFRTDAGTTTSTYGILVGTGTSAESINDTALQTQVAHGASAGQLQYGAMTYAAPSTTATTTTFRCTRVFTNASGGTVTVQEIGLVSREQSNSFLLIRDLTGAVAVNNGQQLTVNYDFTTTI